jgi:hypothetical protein
MRLRVKTMDRRGISDNLKLAWIRLTAHSRTTVFCRLRVNQKVCPSRWECLSHESVPDPDSGTAFGDRLSTIALAPMRD